MPSMEGGNELNKLKSEFNKLSYELEKRQCCECIHFKSGIPTWEEPIPMDYCNLKNEAKYGNEDICKNFGKQS